MKKNITTATNNTTTMNKESQFYEDLGRLVAKYYFADGIPFQKTTFIFNPENVSAPAPAKEPTKTEILKNYGKTGLNVKNASAINAGGKSYELVEKIATKFGIKVKEGKTGNRNGYLNCPVAMAAIIDRYEGEKLVEEAMQVLIDAKYHESDHGITREKIELVTRILALHQRRGHAKVKEELTKLLCEHTIDSILVLAKDTKKYTQRTQIDMMVFYVESMIAKQDGIRNQLEK